MRILLRPPQCHTAGQEAITVKASGLTASCPGACPGRGCRSQIARWRLAYGALSDAALRPARLPLDRRCGGSDHRLVCDLRRRALPPRPDFVLGVLRWGNRVTAYAFVLVTDQHPPSG